MVTNTYTLGGYTKANIKSTPNATQGWVANRLLEQTYTHMNTLGCSEIISK